MGSDQPAFAFGSIGRRRGAGKVQSPGMCQALRDPPGVPNRPITADQREHRHMPGTLPDRRGGAADTDGENLATPDRAVAAVAGAVQGGHHHRAGRDAVLRQQRQSVRIVVLHPQQGNAVGVGIPLGPAGGRVTRVQIADDDLRGLAMDVE